MVNPKSFSPMGPYIVNSLGERVLAFNDRGRAISIDSLTQDIINGLVFVSGHFWLDVADDAYADFRMLVGANQLIWFGFASAGGDGVVQVFKDTTYTDGGTSVPIYPQNENDPGSLITTCFHTPTINVLGSAIGPKHFIAGGTKASAVGGEVASTQPHVTLPNTDYLIRTQNIAGAVKNVNMLVTLFEV